MQITDRDRSAVADAIAEAERATSGEIYCVVTRASDDYRFIPLLWAALASLAMPAPLIFLTMLPAPAIFLAQLVSFVVLALALSWRPLRMACVPPAVRRQRAHARALELFLAHGLHTTSARTGVLLFLSLAEHHAEVVADEGIYAKVTPQVWDDAVTALIAGARRGAPGEAFVEATRICGAVLARHFPPGADDRNELANRLVEL